MVNFYVGQKVVCIRDDWGINASQRSYVPNSPTSGCVYTIREIVSLPQDKGFVGLRLVELRNPEPPWDAEARWHVSRFRPVVERKTKAGFRVLEEILRNSKAPVTDDAFHASHNLGVK